MAVELQIIPECYVDTTLVSAILGGIGVNHQKSCNNVVASMRGRYGDDFAVGIIDNDKRKPGYLNEFSLIASSVHLSLYKHAMKYHYIITITPASEVFLLDAVCAAGLSMTDFGLPDNLKCLKRITKHIVTCRDPRLVNLFIQLGAGGEVALLKEVLEYLLRNKYAADNIVLRGFF